MMSDGSERFDAIVGAAAGGLCAPARLAKAGFSTLLLDVSNHGEIVCVVVL